MKFAKMGKVEIPKENLIPVNIFMSRFVLVVLPVLSEHQSWGVVWLTPAEKLSDVVVDVSIIALEKREYREKSVHDRRTDGHGDVDCPFGLRNGFGGVGKGGGKQKNEKKCVCILLRERRLQTIVKSFEKSC